MAKPAPKSTKTAVKKVADSIELPSPKDARAVFAAALAPRQTRARDILRRLQAAPPQVLIMEGGSVEERAAMAFWYAAMHSCSQPHGPCLECPACLQVGVGFHADVTVLDGRQGSINIDTVRELRTSLSEAPHGDGKRVVLLLEAQALGIEAANALLKSLEEPRPKLCFALLAPQRERLLPTLVSRGWTLTLAWPEHTARIPEDLAPWVRTLEEFLETGQGLFAQTSIKGALDADMARRLLVCVQKGVATVLSEPQAGQGISHNPLVRQLAPLTLAAGPGLPPAQGCAYVSDIIAQAQSSLDYMVNPALVMDWFGVRLYQVISRLRKR